MGLRKKFITWFLFLGCLFTVFVVVIFYDLRDLKSNLEMNRDLKDLVSDINLEITYVNSYHNYSGRLFFDNLISRQEVSLLSTKLNEIAEDEELICDKNISRLNKLYSLIDKKDFDKLSKASSLFLEYDKEFSKYKETVAQRIKDLDGGMRGNYTEEYIDAQSGVNEMMERLIYSEQREDNDELGINYLLNISFNKIDKSLKKILVSAIILLIMFVSAFMVTMFYLCRFVLRPILKIGGAVEKIKQDNFNIANDLNIKNKDEIGALANGVVSMAHSLQKNQIKTEEIVKGIVDKYKKKTKKLNNKAENK